MQQLAYSDDTPNPYESYSRSALIGKIHQLETANELAWNKIKELQRYERQLIWQRQLHSVKNNQTSAADKLVAGELKRIADERPPNEHGVYSLFVPAIAENTGLSDDTVSKSLRKFDKARQIVYKVGRDKEEGKLHSSFIPAANFLEKPQEMVLKENSNHGGKRIKCSECGSEDIIERRICRGCGAVVRERDVNKEVEEEEEEEVNQSVHAESCTEPIPLNRIKRPWQCHCGKWSMWIEDLNGISHCKECEPLYRSY